jgi:hypothetical protein
MKCTKVSTDTKISGDGASVGGGGAGVTGKGERLKKKGGGLAAAT